VATRPAAQLLGSWPRDGQGRLDLERAPFRLNAVVFRLDVATQAGAPGEARLVFAGVEPLHQAPVEFSLIFEFALPAVTGLGIAADRQWWARQLIALGEIPLGETHRQALADLLKLAMKPRSDGSPSIAQVRSNDFFLRFSWELREFKPSGSGALVQAPVAQTPDLSFDDARAGELVTWVQANRDALASGKYQLPRRFLAAAAPVVHETFRWLRGKMADNDAARTQMSLGTCNGCHAGETGTRFTHVGPRYRGSESRKSGWLDAQLVLRARALQKTACSALEAVATPTFRWVH
jgi:hypothetical protein